MAKNTLPINLELLRWAREKAGMSHAAVAELGKVQPLQARGEKPKCSAVERVQAWEEGTLPLTWRQLEKIAKVYRRPALTFFLSAPPIEEVKLADFRTVGDRPTATDTPEFSAFLRRIEVLHDGIIELIEATQKKTLPFISSVSTKTPIQSVAKDIRDTLNFSFDEQKKLQSSDELFRTLRRKAQDAGIFVLVEGDLGSYHSQISPDEFRGIAICHPKAPLVVINQWDAKAAQLFTFIHELVHIWLGDSAVSNASALKGMQAGRDDCEAFCNQVAAEFLVPAAECLDVFAQRDPADWQNTVSNMARRFKVSRAVVARRLYDLNRINHGEYWSYFTMLQKQWGAAKSSMRKTEGGPNRNVLDKFRLGEKLINTVVGGAADGLISLQDASRILKVKVARFDAITR